MLRIIMHIDMDYFFAQIEEKRHPQLKGKPLIIGADPRYGKGRGVVSTCNYAARKFGVHSAQPISKAWRLCPNATFLRPDPDFYADVSKRVMKIIKSYSDIYESAGIDEIYLDVSKSGSYQKAIDIANNIKQEIRRKEGLTCSIGIAANKLLAKIASDESKPDGLTVVTPKMVDEFLEHKSVRKLWGIGPKTEMRLNEMGIFKIKDLKKLSKEKLKNEFGSRGEDFYYMSRGIDERPVEEIIEIKSIGRQVTFETDTDDNALLIKSIWELAKDIHQEVKEEGFLFKTVTIVIRFKPFETHTKSHTLKEYTDKFLTLKAQAFNLLLNSLQKNRPVRLIGLRVSRLKAKA